jgi:heparan-alpha-glucosaminide N-acetyltransferase
MPNRIVPPDPSRIQSIDVLRGLTILVMLFVNDVAGVAGAPGWMKHVFPSTADGMTFVDVVFPAFLFIVGLSLPSALERRLGKGGTTASASGHVLLRTFSLLVIGVLMVNTENISENGLLPPAAWQLLMYAGICLVWIRPGEKPRWNPVWRRLAGAALLAVLVLLYRGEPGGIGFRTQWWGIIGLIGWAYAVTAGLYLALRRNALGFAGAVALLYCVYLGHAAGFFGFLGGFGRWIEVGSVLGSHAAITASGALLGMTLLPPARPHRSRIKSVLFFAGVLACAAILLHSMHGVHRAFIYNKNAATPPWCLLSSAWTALLFAGVYWMVDARGFKPFAGVLASAGQNALFAFILGPIIYSLLGLLPGLLGGADPWWGWLGGNAAVGIVRSLAFASAATFFTAWLQRRGASLRV